MNYTKILTSCKHLKAQPFVPNDKEEQDHVLNLFKELKVWNIMFLTEEFPASLTSFIHRQ